MQLLKIFLIIASSIFSIQADDPLKNDLGEKSSFSSKYLGNQNQKNLKNRQTNENFENYEKHPHLDEHELHYDISIDDDTFDTKFQDEAETDFYDFDGNRPTVTTNIDTLHHQNDDTNLYTSNTAHNSQNNIPPTILTPISEGENILNQPSDLINGNLILVNDDSGKIFTFKIIEKSSYLQHKKYLEKLHEIDLR